MTGKVAWVTGAGSGIGQAAAIALAQEGATVVLTGRRKEPLEETAATIKKAGGKAVVKAADLMKASAVTRIAADIDKRFGRCDILVNNAGLNILDRKWNQLTSAAAKEVIDGNLSSAFYCASAVLPMMRKRKDGVLIHTSSMAGRIPQHPQRRAYSAAKHGVVAMSHTINMEEGVNGIRSCVVCPGEVATPILDRRPVPITKEERARMAQSEDVGDLIRYVACLPLHIVINEVMINPTWNRGYVGPCSARATRRSRSRQEVVMRTAAPLRPAQEGHRGRMSIPPHAASPPSGGGAAMVRKSMRNSTTMTVTIKAKPWRLSSRTSACAGCSTEEGGRIGRYLVSANLSGHDSHGVVRVPRYLPAEERHRAAPTSAWTSSSIRRCSPWSTASSASARP